MGTKARADSAESRRLTTLPPAEVQSRRPSRGRRVLLAAAIVMVTVVITLPWLLVWRGARSSSVPPRPQAAVEVASVVPTAPALLQAIRLPFEFRPVPRRAFQARSAATVVHALLNTEQPAMTEPVSPELPATASPVTNRERATTPAPVAPVPSSSPTVVLPPDPPVPVDTQLSAVASPAPAPTPTPPAPTPTPPAAATPSPAATAVPTEERQVTTTLRQYALAFEQLDATAVARVWPTADQRALSKAFDAIEFQEVSLDTCNVRVSGGTAVADCDGRITYVPKVGKKDPRLVVRKWDFALQKNGDAWTITTAAVR